MNSETQLALSFFHLSLTVKMDMIQGDVAYLREKVSTLQDDMGELISTIVDLRIANLKAKQLKKLSSLLNVAIKERNYSPLQKGYCNLQGMMVTFPKTVQHIINNNVGEFMSALYREAIDIAMENA